MSLTSMLGRGCFNRDNGYIPGLIKPDGYRPTNEIRDKIMNVTIRTIISAAFFLLSTNPLSAQEVKEEGAKANSVH